MPVGFVSIFQIAQKKFRQGRTTFTSAERAHIDLVHYRRFLLGVSDELLPDTPYSIVDQQTLSV
jgi:hypothetical protein